MARSRVAASSPGSRDGTEDAEAPRMHRAVASVVFLVGLSWASSARADCAAPPSACYCRGAAGVVEGEVDALLADGVSVRVESVVESTTPSGSTPAVGASIVVTTADLYGVTPGLGEHLLVAFDASGQVLAPAHVIEPNGEVSCDATRLGAGDTAQLMVLEPSACRGEVEQRFGEYECDDTSSCAITSPSRQHGHTALALLLALMASRRAARRRGSRGSCQRSASGRSG